MAHSERSLLSSSSFKRANKGTTFSPGCMRITRNPTFNRKEAKGFQITCAFRSFPAFFTVAVSSIVSKSSRPLTIIHLYLFLLYLFMVYFPFSEKLFYEKMNCHFPGKRYRKCSTNGASCKMTGVKYAFLISPLANVADFTKKLSRVRFCKI